MLGLAVALALLWVSSYRANFGVGIGAATAMGACFVEVTTVTDGLLIVRNGTRTDSICYDRVTGWEELGYACLHLLNMQKVGGPHVLWPRVEHPAPWCGPYVFVPLWMPILVCLALGCALAFRHRHPPGTCTTCGYPLSGLPRGAPCPECGRARSGSANVGNDMP